MLHLEGSGTPVLCIGRKVLKSYIHPSAILYIVSEQFSFSGVGLLAPCPPPAILEDR